MQLRALQNRFLRALPRSGLRFYQNPTLFSYHKDQEKASEDKVIMGPYYRVMSDHKLKYEDEGWLVLDHVINKMECDHLRGEYDHLIEDPDDDDGLESEDEEEGSSVKFAQCRQRSQILRPREFFKPFKGNLFENRAKSIATQLLIKYLREHDFSRLHDEINQYNARLPIEDFAQQMRFRQDAGRLPSLNGFPCPEGLSVTLFLDDVEDFVNVVSGSHSGSKLRNHEPSPDGPVCVDPLAKGEESVKVKLEKGSALIRNFYLMNSIGGDDVKIDNQAGLVRTVTHFFAADKTIAKLKSLRWEAKLFNE